MKRQERSSENRINDQKVWDGAFHNLKAATKEKIRGQAVFRRFEDAESIDMGEFFNGQRIWALLQGELHFVMRDEEGRTIVLLKIKSENSGFALPQGCQESLIYSMEAVCVGKTELCYIPEMLSSQLYNECADVRNWQGQCNMRVFTKLLELINDLTFLSLKERLEKKLYEYCRLYQTDTIMVTHERLAEELATSREVISRLLKKMEAEHILCVRRKSIQVLDWGNYGELKEKKRKVS